MKPFLHLSVLRLVVPAALLGQVASAQLSNYWPINESAGAASTANQAGGTVGTLFNGAQFVTDAQRGQVLEFNGAGSYVEAGLLPLLSPSSDFTWSFWEKSTQDGGNNVILGNRFSASGGEFTPGEWVKFTPSNFEYVTNGTGQSAGYGNLPVNTWSHVAAVKRGSLLMAYVNGVIRGTNYVSQSTNNQMPIYFGGSQGAESWAGRLDDVATFASALPNASIVALSKGTATPANVALTAGPSNLTTVFSDNFSGGLTAWNQTNRGLENNAPAGYNAPSINGNGQLVLGGTANNQYWYGSSLESVSLFDATKVTEVSVDRISIAGAGSAFRSSLWILGDNSHYLHFSQNVNEGGWTFNGNDIDGLGNANSTGGGNNLNPLDALDGDLGLHNMKIRMEPTGEPGDINMFMYLDGNLVGAKGFTNFPSTFQVVLTGQGRAAGDNVSATFDNLVVAQVPEPGSAMLLLAGSGLLLRRRRG